MVMQDTRMIGVDSGGYPAQPDATAIIRAVDNRLIAAMDITTPLIIMCGGLDGFTVNNPKHEWVNKDNWSRRINNHGGLAGTGTLQITVTAQAHRYPIGTIFQIESELIRVTGHVDANTLTVSRAYAGTSAAIHASNAGTVTGVILYVAGSSMSEDDNWVYRPTPIVDMPYNYCMIDHTALRNTWARQATNLYGISGADELDVLTADTLAEKTVAIEGELIMGRRYSGAAGAPASAGGLFYYITSANGADVTDKASAALTLADITGMLQRQADKVGIENVPNTLVMDQWGKQKISSFFAGSKRLTQGERIGGTVIDTLETEWGPVKLVMHANMPYGNILGFRTNDVEIGHWGATGLLHTGEVMQNDGPFTGRYVYMAPTFRIRNIRTMARIHSYSIGT